ncbi:hypothetical protein PVAND_014103 [Polypedilum vanderplanki]|uniref:Uncharacterized protein n=1 Tax=Polypedilum vanderplanki TaxID=319348 RepID=A0A9J6CS65_POLVA|nr:hypothetical protein PVAND_014103 [Polypedilum vanderplanki]
MAAIPINKPTECENIETQQLMKILKMISQQIKEFNIIYTQFLEEQRKEARELWILVTRYNILNSGPPCIQGSILIKEEILEELIVKIQEKTSCIHHSLQTMNEKLERLSKHKELLYTHSDNIEWNPAINFTIKGSINHRSFSQCLEEIADVLFQYDVSVTCMNHYFEALNLRDCNTYQNLINSFNLSKELTDFVNEFQTNCNMVFN